MDHISDFVVSVDDEDDMSSDSYDSGSGVSEGFGLSQGQLTQESMVFTQRQGNSAIHVTEHMLEKVLRLKQQELLLSPSLRQQLKQLQTSQSCHTGSEQQLSSQSTQDTVSRMDDNHEDSVSSSRHSGYWESENPCDTTECETDYSDKPTLCGSDPSVYQYLNR